MSVIEEKKALRTFIRKKERTLDPTYKAESSEAICRHLLALDEYKSAKIVFAFAGTEKEIDTSLFMNETIAAGKTLILPRCAAEHAIDLCVVRSMDDLEAGAYGILEPKKNCALVTAADIDFAVVPCLSFDRKGRRLGQVLRARGRRWYRAELGSQSAFKFSAHLRLLSQRFFEGLQRRVQPGLHGAERLVQDLGDLPELQLVDVAEHDHLPLLFRQRGDELHEAELRLDLFKAGLNVLLRPQGLGAAVSPPQVGAGICRDLVQIRPELSPVRIGVEVPYRLQEGLLRRILRRLPVRRVPQAISEYGRIGVDYKLLQRRPVTPAQPPEQLVFPRQNTTSRRERPLTEYNARAAKNDWRREIFLKPHFAPRRSKSAQTRLVPAVPSLVQVFGGFHIQLSAVAPVFIAGSSRAFCRSCPPDRD